MGGGWPIGYELCNGNDQNTYNFASGTPGGGGIAVVAGNGVYGSLTQIVAATTFDTEWMIVFCTVPASYGSSWAWQALCEIAIGPSGSERIIIPDLSFQIAQSANLNSFYSFPISIPKGTRISAACCEPVSNADTYGVHLQLFDGGFTQMSGAQGVDSIGMTVSTTLGTAVTPGNQVMGSWTQLIAATVHDYMGIIITMDNQNTAPQSDHWGFDIGIGPSGSEQVLVQSWPMSAAWTGSNGIASINSPSPFFPTPVPARSRLAVRSISHGGATGQSITVYGIYR